MNSRVINYPTQKIKLPPEDVVERLLTLPVTQMFCTSRSGTTAFHAMLDSHPDILQVCDIFKFYDFLYTLGTEDTTYEIVGEKFIESELHSHIFDTHSSNTHKDHLGYSGDISVKIDKEGFLDTLLCLSKAYPFTIKNFYYFIHMSYELCLGKEITSKKIVFQHLHHGDWVYPHLLANTAKLFGKNNLEKVRNVSNQLQADRQIIMIRNPYKSLYSVQQFCDRYFKSSADSEKEKETQLVLLAQEFIRNAAIKLANSDKVYFLYLEKLKANPRPEISEVCKFLEISPNPATTSQLTYFGETWLGDVSMKPEAGLRKETEEMPTKENCTYLNLLCADAIKFFGYKLEHNTTDDLVRYLDHLKQGAKRGDFRATSKLKTLESFQQLYSKTGINFVSASDTEKFSGING